MAERGPHAVCSAPPPPAHTRAHRRRTLSRTERAPRSGVAGGVENELMLRRARPACARSMMHAYASLPNLIPTTVRLSQADSAVKSLLRPNVPVP
eukprot:2960328-Pleurochrysis_carterae.AAC.4